MTRRAGFSAAPSASLETQISRRFEFLRTNVDGFWHDWSVLYSPKQMRLEAALLALRGAFDSNGSFLNDLRIYLRYTDSGLQEQTIELTDRIGQHYCTILRQSLGKDNFKHLAIPFLRPRVKYYEPGATDPAIEARASSLADAIFGRVPATPPYRLGNGGAINELSEYEWLLLIHDVIPIAAPELISLVPEVDIGSLTNPFSVIVSSGPIHMKRSERNDVGSKKTQGAVFLDASLIYANPLAEQVAELRSTLSLLVTFMKDVDEVIRTGLESFEGVKQRVLSLETTSLSIASISTNNASMLSDIKRRLDDIP